jgi:hypothetical protein
MSIWAKSFPPPTKPIASRVGNIQSGGTVIIRTIASSHNKEALAVNTSISNLFLSQCFSCKSYAVWLADALIHPTNKTMVEPHEDMPPGVKEDFLEASSIVDRSPRGAAALLRLALQKLMGDLGEKGKNINEDIKSLVAKGLESEIQKALDIVRAVGNNAVHPGELDLKDDKATAITLLNLVNIIVDRRISAAKRIDKMFRNLPTGALEAIAKRDATE